MNTLSDGSPVTENYREIDPLTGQQKNYVVLSEEDRLKGFIRPVRNEYKHLVCGFFTRMNSAIVETYARQPDFYSGTFCISCKEHRPLKEFVWKGTNEMVGS